MKVDIYQSKTSPEQFLTVPAGTVIATMELPVGLATVFASADAFMVDVEMRADEPRVAMKPQEILADIERHGFAIHGTKTTLTVGSHPGSTGQPSRS